MKFPNKLYETLTAAERTRAFVEAVARRDNDELDRLNDTCPRYAYTCEDADFVRMRLNTWLITLIVHQEASYYAEIAGAATTLLMGYDGDRGDKLEEVVIWSIRHFREVYRGFDLFCDHIGVSAETMRLAYLDRSHPMMGIAEEVFGDSDDAQADEAAAVAMCESLVGIWEAGE
jgi:hypothetical protein